MSPVTLATCIAPNILSYEPTFEIRLIQKTDAFNRTQELLLDPFEQTAQHNSIVSFIIQNYEEIFLSSPVADRLGGPVRLDLSALNFKSELVSPPLLRNRPEARLRLRLL